jgi:hypothetical protein
VLALIEDRLATPQLLQLGEAAVRYAGAEEIAHAEGYRQMLCEQARAYAASKTEGDADGTS